MPALCGPIQRDDGGVLRRSCRGVRVFGGVPLSILNDNTKLAVARILGDGARQRHEHSASSNHITYYRSVRPPWQGQRQGEGGGPGRVDPAELPCAVPLTTSFAALKEQLVVFRRGKRTPFEG